MADHRFRPKSRHSCAVCRPVDTAKAKPAEDMPTHAAPNHLGASIGFAPSHGPRSFPHNPFGFAQSGGHHG